MNLASEKKSRDSREMCQKGSLNIFFYKNERAAEEREVFKGFKLLTQSWPLKDFLK